MPGTSSKESQPQTVKLQISLTPRIKERLIEDSEEKFGNRKGAVSLNLEQILRVHFGFQVRGSPSLKRSEKNE